jgi:hypothetical protein
MVPVEPDEGDTLVMFGAESKLKFTVVVEPAITDWPF